MIGLESKDQTLKDQENQMMGVEPMEVATQANKDSNFFRQPL